MPHQGLKTHCQLPREEGKSEHSLPAHCHPLLTLSSNCRETRWSSHEMPSASCQLALRSMHIAAELSPPPPAWGQCQLFILCVLPGLLSTPPLAFAGRGQPLGMHCPQNTWWLVSSSWFQSVGGTGTDSRAGEETGWGISFPRSLLAWLHFCGTAVTAPKFTGLWQYCLANLPPFQA